MRRNLSAILIALALLLGAPGLLHAQGYLNPPVYATGTVFAVTGVTGATTTPIKNAYAPNNLNIYNRSAITTWTIIMPFPAFDAQIIDIGCPGGNVTAFAITTVSGSGDTIGSGGPTACTAAANSLFMYQYQAETLSWRFITAMSGGGGGSSLTITDNTHTVTAVTTEIVVGATVSGSTPNATVTVNPQPLVVGTTVITSGTNGDCLYDNAGILGNQVCASGSGTVTSVSITPGPGILQSGSPITNSGAITVSADIATNSQVWAHTANKLIDANVAATSIAPVTTTESAGVFSINFASGINLDLPLVHADCPCTMANPTNVYAGLSGNISVIQSSTGSDTINTWGSTWKFPGGVMPTFTSSVNAIDILPFYCRTTTYCAITLVSDVK